jgi:hypothetical protein
MMAQVIPETFLSPEQQLALFGGSCLLGIPCGLLFDVFRLLRRLIPHHPAAVAAEDMLTPVLWGILLAGYTTSFAKGDFRLYYVIGMLTGFVLYECTLGRLVLCIGTAFCAVVRAPLRILGWGFRSFCRKVLCIFVGTSKKTKREQKNAQNPLHSPP